MGQTRCMKIKALAIAAMLCSSEAFLVASKLPVAARPTARASCTQLSMSKENRGAARTAAAFAALATMPMQAFGAVDTPQPSSMSQVPTEIRYSEFLKLLDKNEIEKVTFSSDGQRLIAVDTDGDRVRLDALPNDPDLLNSLTKKKVDVTVLPAGADSAAQGGMIGNILSTVGFPLLIFAGLFFLASRGRGEDGEQGGMGGGGPGGMGNPQDFGRTKAKLQMQPDTGTKFEDVAGCDQAKLELEEVVDFLKAPGRYTDLGAQIPRGVILEGPPGTGKTLLARAVAGEAGVPFIAVSGSEFVEMFVGVGASRVRDLFGQAKKNAPCIIFIDEIDAIGRQRGAGMAGGNDEREQTLNQILTEMDGFEGNGGIIVIAATNRADILDNALLRPGRFDRRVNVALPEYAGRIAILKVHARGKPLSPDVDFESLAKRTPGFSGASLQNLLNEAAIRAARSEKTVIDWEDVDSALDRITVGMEKKGGNQGARMKEIVAYHEAGHAVAGALTPDYDMVQKVSIIPRSNGAGGITFFAPTETRLESGLYSRQYLEAQLSVALGGRVAEELIYGETEVTTGASNDLSQVARIAKAMIGELGMSEKVGNIVVSGGDGGDMGMSMGGDDRGWDEQTLELVDDEVQRVVTNAYVRCKDILTKNMSLLETLAGRLIENESVTAEELSIMIAEEPNLWMPPYGVYDEENSPTEALPFAEQPDKALLTS
ncbi:unnamed protein product [Chrysoparadoxa australica]